MSAMKLQKLVYYCQAWHLVWEDEPLFPERIEAWASGPVVPALYDRHRGEYTIATWSAGDPSQLAPKQLASIDAILKHYGDHSAFWLSELTHKELPWREAREGLPAGARSGREITTAAMSEYYSSLV
jgi:uncharacterized phage-associated protein